MTLTHRIRRTALGLLAAALAATLGVTLAPPTQPAHAGLYYNYSIENRTMLPLSLVSAKVSDGTVLLGAPKTIPAVHQATFSAPKGGMNNRPIVQVTYSFTDEDGSTRKLVLNGTRNGGEDDSTCYTDSAIFRCDIALATSPFNDSGTIFILERKLFTTIPVDDTTQPLLWRQLVDLCFVSPPTSGLAHCEPASNGEYRAIMSNTYYEVSVLSWLNLPLATGGEPYSAPVHASTAVVDGYPITVTGLPNGLSYDAAQQRIVGTPLTPGTTYVRFGVTLPNGTTLPLSVIAKPLIVAASEARVLTKALPTGTIGRFYDAPITVYEAGGQPSVIVSGLPGGLSYYQDSGRVLGAPTAVGTFPVVFKVAWAGVTNTTTLQLTINWLPPQITSVTLPPVTVGTFAQRAPTSDLGGAPWASATMTATGVPPGMAFDAVYKSVYGTPTAGGSYDITFTLTTSGGTATKIVRLDVKDRVPEITTTSLTRATVGESYENQLHVETFGAYAKVVAAGLPPGLVYGPSGAISGKASAAGTYQVKVTATTSGGSATRTLTLVVLYPTISSGPLPPKIVTTVLPNATASRWYMARILVDRQGVAAGYMTVTGLPSGLRFDAPTEAIVGTPTQLGSFPISITVTSNGGQTSTKLMLVVRSP